MPTSGANALLQPARGCEWFAKVASGRPAESASTTRDSLPSVGDHHHGERPWRDPLRLDFSETLIRPMTGILISLKKSSREPPFRTADKCFGAVPGFKNFTNIESRPWAQKAAFDDFFALTAESSTMRTLIFFHAQLLTESC